MNSTTRDLAHAPFPAFTEKMRAFCRLIGIVALQDMRTRYGQRSHFGYLITLITPLVHISFLTAIYYVRTAVAPVGDSPALFITTGALPYIVCIYPSREAAKALMDNRQLLSIPVLQPLHLMLARCLLESLNAIFVMATFLLGLYLFDIDIAPIDYLEAASALGASVILGVAFGLFNVMMCGIFGYFFSVVAMLLMMALFLVSGVYVPVWTMPEEAQKYLYYNPIYHLVEWSRSAYFISYESGSFDKAYVLVIAGSLAAIALLGDRLFRGKIISW
ncbi:ABC transporter permease [Methylocystis parvus]|uniref:ABC transporter permease n=1 Tax=Methylocystis parvus TaxID=134 RepID=UPI003C777DD1